MKQKVTVKAIIKQDDKILLLRRSGGRPSIRGFYELPGGRVHYYQQPEDALAHALRIHLSVSLETAHLKDAMTFIDPDDRELQYVFILYEVSLKPTDRAIEVSQEYDKYLWKKLSEIQRETITQSTQQLLGLQQVPFTTGEEPKVIKQVVDKKSTSKHVIVYSDGGSRGNPGPSASGFVILDEAETMLCQGGAFIGFTTNNVAEYQALYLGLEKALELGAEEVDFRLDSLLVVNQMNGLYKIKNADLIPIHNRIKELASRFKRVTYRHVYREYNKLADGMVNKLLDEAASTSRPEALGEV